MYAGEVRCNRMRSPDASRTFRLMRASSQKNLVVGGGVENILHTNNISENINSPKGICTQLSRPKEVGGYMKRADWSRFEKSYSVLQAFNYEVALCRYLLLGTMTTEKDCFSICGVLL